MKNSDKTKEQLVSELNELRKKSKREKEELKAANQQLQASEQQLKASNQQLDANNQQLMASEKALKESEENYKLTVENLQAGIVVHSSDGSVLFSNPKASHILGLTQEQMQGKELINPSWSFVNGDLSIMKVEDYPVSRVIATKQRFDSYQVGIKTEERDYITWVVVNAKPVFSDNELDKIIINFVDITARKQADKALRESEEQYRLLAETAKESIFIHDMQGKILYVNKVVEELLNLKKEEICELNIKQFIPAYRIDALEKRRNTRIRGDVDQKLYEEKVVLGGREIYIEVSSSPVIREGEMKSILVVARDITERKQAEVEKEKLESQLHQAQKMESVGRLAGGVAHDFNNMLGVILGHADMILEGMDPDQPFHADLTKIKKAGEHSADLTRQLLAFARKQTVTPKVINLNKTVKDMLKMLHRLIGEDIDLAWIPGETVWPVKIDPAQIDQVLANLCVNARDAIVDVGKVTIETSKIVFDEDYCHEHAGFVPGEYTLLAVSDNGCGMDAETLENVFDPFFTTKELDK
ncbi:MAG: PAS domain S-box protein, partial [Pseudomonadota bacterium]|nr:PAS domain S-box protein [Pseudomonadota bacterium]